MRVWALVLWVGCTPRVPGVYSPRPAEPVTDGPAPTGATGDTSSTSTGSTAFTGDTGPTIDCTILPPVPVVWDTMNQFETAEDFDIDIDGYLCSINAGNLTCKDQTGDSKLIAPGVVGGSAGTRVLPTGDWVIADTGRGAMVRVDAISGASQTFATGLEYPNGVEVDADNMVYVAENNGARVRQIDAYTGEQWEVADGLSQPNGVILSPDGQTMYVGSFGGGVVYAIDRLGPTEWDEERVLFNPMGPDSGFDGINVDICGNVYITEYVAGKVYRITPSGEGALVASLGDGWIPNMRWGHGIGGWRTDVLYVSAWSRVHAMEMGIEGKKHVGLP